MPDTALYRNEHLEIIRIIDDMKPLLDFVQVSGNPLAINKLFIKLSEILSPHMAMEEKHLYPYLYVHHDSNVQIPAIRFYYQHKEILRELKKYQLKWAEIDSIQKRPFEFIQDCNLFCETVRLRIEKENTELFPLVERDFSIKGSGND